MHVNLYIEYLNFLHTCNMHLPCLWLVIPTATRYSTVLLIAWFIRSCTLLCLNCWTCQICSSGLQLFNLIINYQFNSDFAITILSGYCDHVNSLSVQRCLYSHLYFLYGYCDKSEQESWFAIIFVVMHSTAVLLPCDWNKKMASMGSCVKCNMAPFLLNLSKAD